MNNFNLKLANADRELYLRSYYEFFKWTFELLEPQKEFLDNWHYEYICSILQKEIERIGRGEISLYDVIIINVPPRTGKSYMVARALNAWAWIKYPWMRFVGASYASSLASSHALDTRRIIKNSKYQQLFGDKYSFAKDQDVKTRYDTNEGGMRLSLGVDGGVTGEGGDLIWADDPLNAKQAASATFRNSANEWFDKTFFTRLNNFKTGIRIVVMQRLHDDDVTGHILKKAGSEYRVLHISLPAELNSKKDNVIPNEISNRYIDGLLFPGKLDKKELNKQKMSLGPYGYAGQFEQKPSPEGGGRIKKKWFPIIRASELPNDIIKHFYTDPAGGKESGDEMASGCWSIYRGKIYIWNMLSVKKRFNDFVGLYIQNEKGYKKIREGEYDRFMTLNKGNSSSMHFMETNSTIGQGYVDYGNENTPYRWIEDNVNGLGSKEVRVEASIPTLWAGRVILIEGEWNESFLEQVEIFPMGDQDGQVDVLSSIIRKSDLNEYTEEENKEKNGDEDDIIEEENSSVPDDFMSYSL